MEEQLRIINERMRRIDRERLRIIERCVGNMGILPSKHYALLQIDREGKVASQARVAEMLHVSPARVTLVLKSLESDGYIERSTGTDGRRNEITITEKGEALLAKSRAFFKELNEETYGDFTQEECDQFLSYLERVLHNLHKIVEELNEEDA